ncbi:cell division protein SepF [Serinicoccus sp. CNJ-927]|uniref:cell division protein SepF n=1 Tax=Serinicoccus sp. CNJ-927 TaxID=1904970 RepID=UPI000962B85A|nr:cell division protein SepF [Serinicoccus sp. CNJ-927]OLT39876.1 cell division protein SepF [Serinicoccus sp. CNJ-927]
MAGALRKTMEYLGLAESDERFDDYDTYEQESPEQRGSGATVRQLRDGDTAESHGEATVATLPSRTPVSQVVREPEVGELNRITTIHPRTYNEAKTIGEAFRGGVPVIMNLSDMDDADAKRLVDFAAGLAFGLHGSIERVTSKVFLLSPSFVEVDGGSQPEQVRGAQGPFNQS